MDRNESKGVEARKLDVMICTHGTDGLAMVERMDLPKVAGVTYVVAWQTADVNVAIPKSLRREDVEVYAHNSVGLSHNRNFAISKAKAPVCLVADNDLKYTAGELQSVMHTFESHPEVDLAMFKYKGGRKSYPTQECDLTRRLPRFYQIVSFEMAFRRKSVAGVSFDERFGLGARYGLGEEEVFLYDCRQAGLNCRFFPLTITTHEGLTTGARRFSGESSMEGSGAVIRHLYGFFGGLPRVPLFVFRNWRSGRLALWMGMMNVTRGFLCHRRKRRRE